MADHDGLSAYLARSGVLLAQLSCSCTDEHLATIAEAIDDWETLAPHLGVLKPKQTAIKRDYPGQTVKQKQELLWQWKMQGGIDATYLSLCRVFWIQDKVNLVDRVCDCVGVRATPPQLPAISCGSSIGCRKRPADLESVDLGTAVALRRPSEDTYPLRERPSYYGPLKICKVTYHPPQTRIEAVKGEVCRLQRHFQNLVDKMQNVVKQSMAKDPATFREKFICRLLSIDSSKKPLHQKFLEHKIQEAETIESVFRALSSYWNFINSDLLEHIIAEILPENAALQQDLQSYLTAKCFFCEKTTVCDCEAAKTQLPIVLPQFEIPDEFSVIVLQVVKKWSDYTIAQALATWQSIAEDIQVRKILGFFAGGTSSNSVNLVWAVAPDVVSFIAEALTSQHVRERNAIKAVCIDGKLLTVQETEQEVSMLYCRGTLSREMLPLGSSWASGGTGV